MYDGIRSRLKPNLGKTDRTIRLLVAIALSAGTMLSGFEGWIVAVPLLVAIYLLITGDLSYSPIYHLFHWSTAKKEETN
jgi:hypothetical protein